MTPKLFRDVLLSMVQARDEVNMYGCLPCPKCNSRYRWPTQRDTIQCDDCGHTEPMREQP